MVINESQLRDMIKKSLTEAISRADSNLAQKFIKQAGKGGYTTSQMNSGSLYQQARKALGARSDANGRYDILRSAEEIYPLIQKYNAEIKKLQYAYNFIDRRKNGDYVAPKRSGNHLSADQLQKRRDNAAQRAAINQRYGDINDPSYTMKANGYVDDTKFGQNRQNQRKRNNDISAQGNQGWIGSLRESIFNFLNRGNKADEVDTIVANYKNYANPEKAQYALQKIGQRLQEYKNTVAQLQALLDKWTADGSLVDKNAELRAKRDAELKNVGKGTQQQYRYVAESIDRAVEYAMKKVLG